MSEHRKPFSTHGFAVVVCRNFDGRWLAVKETQNRGWWLPAGLLDPGETFVQAAHRETLEEAGIKVELKGILRVEHSVYGPTHARMRVVFFAMPIDHTTAPKRYADKESEEARWVTLEDLRKLSKKTPGLRGPELYEWGSYIEKGGAIAPLSFLCREDEPLPSPDEAFAAPGGASKTEDYGIDLSDPGIMIEAIEQGDEGALRKCLLSGMEVNLPINDKNWTPLHLACKLNHEEIVYMLLISNGDITINTHKERNVIHFAAQSTPAIMSMIMIRLFKYMNKLEIINQRDEFGDTPLHFAASMFAKSYIWDLLTQNGADPEIKNMSGRTPNDIASQNSLIS